MRSDSVLLPAKAGLHAAHAFVLRKRGRGVRRVPSAAVCCVLVRGGCSPARAAAGGRRSGSPVNIGTRHAQTRTSRHVLVVRMSRRVAPGGATVDLSS